MKKFLSIALIFTLVRTGSCSRNNRTNRRTRREETRHTGRFRIMEDNR